MGSKAIKKIRLKKNTIKNKCRWLKCTRRPRARELCEKHAQYLVSNGEYETYAGPERMLDEYSLKKNTGGSRFIILNVTTQAQCNNPRRSRGICSAHFGQLKRRGIYEEFAL